MILKFYKDRSANFELPFLVPSLHYSHLTLKFLVITLDGYASFVVYCVKEFPKEFATQKA
jgi:hypothetical protein